MSQIVCIITYLRYFCRPSSSVMISSFAYVLYGELNELFRDWFGLTFVLNDVWKSCRFVLEYCELLKVCCWWWVGDRLNADDHIGEVFVWPKTENEIALADCNDSDVVGVFYCYLCYSLSANDECQLTIDVLTGEFALLKTDFFEFSGDLTTNDVSAIKEK